MRDGTRAELSTSARERPQLPTSLRTLSTGPAAPPVQLVWPHSVVVRRESVVLHVHAETFDSPATVALLQSSKHLTLDVPASVAVPSFVRLHRPNLQLKCRSVRYHCSPLSCHCHSNIDVVLSVVIIAVFVILSCFNTLILS